MDIFKIVLVFILLALTAFFVASEFAIVKVRSSRIDQLIQEGNRNAIAAKRVISSLDEYLSACQLGITITALGLGWLGEPVVSKMIEPLFKLMSIPESGIHALSISVAFVAITFVHVVIGELAPKTAAIQKSETVALLTARPLILFYKVLYPFIWTLNSSARFITKLFGLQSVSENELAHSEEELRIILSESYESGEINQSEYKYVNKIFDFDNRIAKEIMVPRTELVSLSKEDTLADFLSIVRQEKFTRYPVIDGDKDHITGLVNVKEILTELIDKPERLKKTIDGYVRPIIRVIDTIPIHDLLLKMQKERIHMAILMDEYGGTSGLVTVEDIIEEIVGEIRDEFDADELPLMSKIAEDHFIFDSKMLVSKVNDLLGTQISDEDVDTIGGWILTENFEAKLGDTLEFEGYEFTIKEMEEAHVLTIEAKKKVVITETEPAPLPLTDTKVML